MASRRRVRGRAGRSSRTCGRGLQGKSIAPTLGRLASGARAEPSPVLPASWRAPTSTACAGSSGSAGPSARPWRAPPTNPGKMLEECEPRGWSPKRARHMRSKSKAHAGCHPCALTACKAAARREVAPQKTQVAGPRPWLATTRGPCWGSTTGVGRQRASGPTSNANEHTSSAVRSGAQRAGPP